MAAYAALVSLMHTVEQIQHHPGLPISLDKQQVESLTENVTFLQEFLEGYNSHFGYSKKADALETRIADAAYAAEDKIETHIVDQILAPPRSHGEKIKYFNCFQGLEKATSLIEKINSIDSYQGLKKEIRDMDSIKKKVMEIKAKKFVHNKQQRDSAPAGPTKQNTMVGFNGVLLEIMHKLTGQQLDRQIIPIVGMGGIGKTTLARNIYQNQVIVQHFDILAWTTISQEYKIREILLKLLQEGREILSQMNEKELGVKLHKRLSGRRYLIIIDDIWDIEVWDQLKFLFPDDNNGSRIMLTTRLSNLASQMAGTGGIEMGLLDEDNSWNLFSEIVFGEEGCLRELEGIGKKIVKNCRGLPLSIVVIGGLLANSNYTREYWEYISRNLNSIVNLEDNERCLKILHMSYEQLPVYLKPCFLYMGVFSEDSMICVSTLVKLWVAEGFLKPIVGKSSEDIAKGYLKELIDRNLILVHTLGSIGSIRYCNIHDLVRDLCLRQARKERFHNVMRRRKLIVPQAKNTQRRVVIPKGTSQKNIRHAKQSMPLARSLICNIKGVLPLDNFRLLRILKANKDLHYGKSYLLGNMFQLVNSRYLAARVHQLSTFPSSVCLLWNLQTLIVDADYKKSFTAPVEIWNMPQLRHVIFRDGLYLPDPPSGNVRGRDDIVLGNLQTLMRIRNFKCGEEVVKRIPNIKKLKTSFISKSESGSPDYFLNNLVHLHKLESFSCRSFLIQSETDILQNLTFPHSLKKLAIGDNYVHWQDMLEKIGSLPFLEKLELCKGSFEGRKWETVEGHFRSLQFLLIYDCRDLECWTIENSHFPRLEHLSLWGLLRLKEIPSEIGEIPTLKSIELRYCKHSAIISAKKILEEQEELYGEVGLQVRVKIWDKNTELERLASPNFQVEHRRRSKGNIVSIIYLIQFNIQSDHPSQYRYPFIKPTSSFSSPPSSAVWVGPAASYDCIIVRAGTAGCPQAATLSRDYTVLLLERGGTPFEYSNVSFMQNFDISRTSASQTFISTDGVFNARARVLGGGTCINTGFYTRASARYNSD